jgi:hypothetical protein
MTSRSLRITVRGHFDRLSEAQTAELVAAAAEHDLLFTAYTAAGYLAYDLPSRPFFTFRFADEVPAESDIAAAAAKAEAKAAAWMAQRGYAVKNLSAQTVDLSEVPLGKRGRRAAARKD